MKVLNIILERKHAIGMMMGIITAVVILSTQTFYYDYAVKNQVEIASEDEEQPSEILTIGHDAVSTVVEYTLQQVLHFISTIYTESAEALNIELEEEPRFNALFKALFRSIISPNAP